MKNAGHLLQDAKPLWKCPPLFESNTPTNLALWDLSAGWRKDLVGLGRPSLQGCRQQLALVPTR